MEVRKDEGREDVGRDIENGKRKMSGIMRSDVWKDDGDAVGRCLGKMVIGGFWKNGGERYLVGR